MPALTRRRSDDRRDCSQIYCGDVQAGTIAMRVGNPNDTNQWEWVCGFYPLAAGRNPIRHGGDL